MTLQESFEGITDKRSKDVRNTILLDILMIVFS